MTRSRFLLLAGLILVAALALRLTAGLRMVQLSRDGVTFCWLAMALEAEGPAALRDRDFNQHPLFPAAVLATHRLRLALGASNSPLAWQLSGQLVAGACGLALVAAAGALAWRLAVVLQSSSDRDAPRRVRPEPAALCAMALTAVNPLLIWLSCDVMSETLHLLLYAGAIWMLMALATPLAAAGCGLLSGLAFLTRPEGVAPLCAAVVLLAWRTLCTAPCGRRRPVALLAVAIGAFLVTAAPYWVMLGRITPKTDKPDVRTSLHETAAPRWAALDRQVVSLWAAGPRAMVELTRSGRVIVVALALGALLAMRRRWGEEPLLALLLCCGAQLAMMSLVVHRAGYLDPRHALPALLALTPIAGLAAARLVGLSSRVGVQLAVAAALLAPLAAYALRVPNGTSRVLVQAADWLRAAEPDRREWVLVGGASMKRIAFYAEMRFQPWDENAATPAARFEALRTYVVDPVSSFLALEIGERGDGRGNAALLTLLLADPEAGPRMREAARFEDETVEVRLFDLRRPDTAQGP